MSKIKKHICMVLSCVLWNSVFTIHANAQRVDEMAINQKYRVIINAIA